jgi:chemotaxis protein MotB
MSQAFSRYGANDEERAKLLNLAPTAISGNATKL